MLDPGSAMGGWGQRWVVGGAGGWQVGGARRLQEAGRRLGVGQEEGANLPRAQEIQRARGERERQTDVETDHESEAERNL